MKRIKLYIVLTVIGLNIGISACGKDVELSVNSKSETISDSANSDSESNKKDSANLDSESNKKDSNDSDGEANKRDIIKDETGSGEIQGDIYVYISGQVKKPGVYCVDSDARIYQVIDMAGGMTDKAYQEYLNLAERVEDGQHIKIMTKNQYFRYKKEQNDNNSEDTNEAVTQNNSDMTENNSDSNTGTIININSATIQELTKLPGIGESKAQAIIKYRNENDGFSSIEDIKNVSGIGDSTFSNIKEYITVN